MKTKEKTIEQYLEFICSLLIDQFNVRYEHFSQDQFKREADFRYVERDWVYKIGEYFKDLAYYEVQDKNSRTTHHDISIPSKDFVIELKYLRNFKSMSNTYSTKKQWSPYEKDFQWLESEILDGNKGKRSFILIWCNCIDYFGQVMQIGKSRGTKNPVNKERLVYFPFLMNTSEQTGETFTKDLKYNYEKVFPCPLDLNFIGKGNVAMDCMFLGGKEDRLHIAIYY